MVSPALLRLPPGGAVQVPLNLWAPPGPGSGPWVGGALERSSRAWLTHLRSTEASNLLRRLLKLRPL